MNNIIKTSLIAHMNYVYPRTLEKKKTEGFKKTIDYLITKLDQRNYKTIKELPEVKEYYMLVATGEYFGYRAGAQMALDMFNEICDNIRMRYEDGYSSSETIERLL